MSAATITDTVNKMIASGQYDMLLSAIKAFRNGFVYGVKVRAPHALVMTLLWSRGPVDQMALKIFRAAKQHGLNLAKAACLFKLVTGVLAKISAGRPALWHVTLAGALAGATCWGDVSPVVVQVNMYALSRLLSGLLYTYLERTDSKLPAHAMRWYSAVVWGLLMTVFYNSQGSLQKSLVSSMDYIYRDSDKYSNVNDLLLMNKPDQI